MLVFWEFEMSGFFFLLEYPVAYGSQSLVQQLVKWSENTAKRNQKAVNFHKYLEE
jgi:hypothetical protein